MQAGVEAGAEGALAARRGREEVAAEEAEAEGGRSAKAAVGPVVWAASEETALVKTEAALEVARAAD